MLRIAIASVLLCASAASAQVAFKEVGTTLEITLAGKPFTTYRFGTEAPKPYFWPIMGPFGAPVTRAFPNVKDAPDEMRDHPHHRGLHFTHGEVSVAGKPHVDFWAETAKSQGKIVHLAFDPAPSVKDGVLTFGVRNKWVSPDGVELVNEIQQWVLSDLGNGEAMIRFSTTLSASGSAVTFDDTKEGSFSIRIPTSMDEQKDKAGPRSTGERGTIVNSAGGIGEKACWGKPADWVDYTGLVAGKRVGIAIFDHPGNEIRCRWHVRAYGLFSANPFGSKSFDKALPERKTPVDPSKTLSLRYGVVIHAGDAKDGKVADRFKQYVEATK